jgi:Xanthosine triphosphate pyrophosphatase
MEKIVYVTGNYGKYINVKNHFEEKGIDIDYFTCDIEELDINDIELISKDKAKKAYEKLGKPCFVGDSGFYIEGYPGNPDYPGAFVKRSGISTDIENLLKIMNDVENRNCRFIDCLTFYDGIAFFSFLGVSRGTLSTTVRGNDKVEAKSNLWRVFIPNNCTKTLAEMTEEEFKDRNDDRTSATEQFIEWYKREYLINNKQKIKAVKH